MKYNSLQELPVLFNPPIQLPRCLRCGFSRYLEQAELMMSSGDTASLLHSHSDHNLHCILTGRKDFILIDPKYKQKLAFKSLVINYATIVNLYHAISKSKYTK